MEVDQIISLKKTLKKWESAFYDTHEKKPTKQDIATAPQRIQDAYLEYNKLRKGGGGGSKENKKEESTAAEKKAEAWGSHLNKSTTSVDDQGNDTSHRTGSLLSKLSHKLYQNYSHSKKTPKRSGKATTSSEHVHQEAPLANGHHSPEKTEGSNDLALSSVFSSSSKLKHKSAMKLTTTSKRLHSQKLDNGLVSSNILMNSQERKHSLKTDWLDKCKPDIAHSAKALRNRSDIHVQERHNDSDAHDVNVDKTSEKAHETSESLTVKDESYSEMQNSKLNMVPDDSNIARENSAVSKVCTGKKETEFQETDSNLQSKSLDDEPEFSSLSVDRTRCDNQDKIPISVTSKECRSKRKRSEDFKTSSKRARQSEEVDDCQESHVPQLSSFESFAFPDEDDNALKEKSIETSGQDSEGEDEEKKRKQKRKRVKKASYTSTGSAGGAVGGSSAPSRNMNENFVKLNMKYKSYSRGRGPGRLKGEAYKRHVWKQRQKGSLADGKRGGGAGRGRGRPGWGKSAFRTEDTCYKCGGKGHWASQCNGPNTSVPKKDIEKDWAMENVGEGEEFPTLEEAALAAAGIKPDKDAIARGEMKAPTVMPPVYEDPIPPPPIEPMFPLGEDGQVIDTPASVMDALNDMGYSSFRQGQEHSIMRILSGLSTLVVLSTGAGKSLTYQLPAYIYAQRSPCITLVISPLVSLMDDQIFGLPKCLKGARLHSNMSKVQREKVVKEIIAGNVNVLLLSPEAIVGGGGKGGGCLPPLDQLPPITFACIDEAHCVSEWSHNFRPSYLMLCRVLKERMGVKCLLGLTATATVRTSNSVAEHLGIAGDKDAVVRGSSVPNNLKLSVSRDANRERAIVELLEGDRFRELESIIVYCIRRDETEKVASLLRTCLKANPVRETPSLPAENTEEESVEEEKETKKKGKKKKKKGTSKKTKTAAATSPPANSVESYHAGMSPAQRRKVQNAFMCSKLRIVVATVAFGMGLDKADVRAVIHYNLPKSYESYVQEIGRAGRDGKPSHCHVFLEPEGSDLCELRRHTYANSIDRVVIKKLVTKVFQPCKCRQLHNLTSEGATTADEATQSNQSATTDKTESSTSEPSIAELQSVLEPWDEEEEDENKKSSQNTSGKRLCPGHPVAIPTEATIQELDIKEESIATLLCYLELHNKRWIRNLPPLYAFCNIVCYGGPVELKATAKKCPPVAVAIAREQMKGKNYRQSSNVEFNAVEVASSMGWDVGLVKKELRQLQWKQIPGRGWQKSGTLVEFSVLALSVRAPGDMTDDDFDEVIEFLAERTKSQEQRELYQLQSVYTALHSVSCKHYGQCCDSVNEKSSDKLKELLREYFQSENAGNNTGDVAWITPDTRQKPEAQEGQVRADVRQFIGLHTDRTFNGRAVARIFHGIASPCYPAQVWGRDRRFWRRHLDYDFSKLVKIATEEVLRMR